MKLSFYILSGSFVWPFLLILVLEKFMKIVDYHSTVKFMFSKKATKNDKIFTVNLTLTK